MARNSRSKSVSDTSPPSEAALSPSTLQRRTGHIELVFRLQGFEDQAVVIGDHYFDGQLQYPAQGALQLDPRHGVWSYLAYAGSRHPAAIGGALLTAILLLWALWRWHASVRRRLQQIHDFETMLAAAPTSEPAKAQATTLGAGVRVGRYVVMDKLGEGASATVYRVLTHEGAVRAMKVMRRETCLEADFRRRFAKEYRITGKLVHPHIVRLEDSGEHEGGLYIVMEALEGGTLRSRIGRPIGLPLAMEWLRPVMQGVDSLHRQGFVHRDLKPENILFTLDGRPKITDFGLSVGLQGSLNKTMTDVVAGTPHYMAPEQVTAGGVDSRTDQYSLGVLVFELLAGCPPFDDPNPGALMYQHLLAPVPSLAAARPDLPPGLSDVVTRMLAKAPAARFASVGDALAALEAASSAIGAGLTA